MIIKVQIISCIQEVIYNFSSTRLIKTFQWFRKILTKSLSIMNSLKIEIPTQTKISIPWIYKLCRHPMQSGILMTIIFSSTDYHFGRLFLICLFTLGVWLGINQEEKLLSREDEYMKYKLMVNNKLVPEITKFFK